MIKVITGALFISAVFILCWFALAQVNWLNLLQVEEISYKLDQKLGEVLSDYILESETVVEDSEINEPVESICTALCKANGIDADELKVYVIEKDEVNAFAFPGNQLIIYSGLINESNNQYELAGVIAHELAHIQLGHIRKKLVKEIGLSALLTISGGGNGAAIKEIVKLLSSSAYDRELEKEADLIAIAYMHKAGINSDYLADFLERLNSQSKYEKYFSWISTHPDTKERVKYIRAKKINPVKEDKVLLSKDDWNNLKNLSEEL